MKEMCLPHMFNGWAANLVVCVCVCVCVCTISYTQSHKVHIIYTDNPLPLRPDSEEQPPEQKGSRGKKEALRCWWP